MTTFVPTILASILLSTLLVVSSAIPRGHVGHVRSHIPVAEAENQVGDYDDFSDLPMNYVRQAYNIPHSVTNQKLLDEFQVPKTKRYLGLDIPDYISSGDTSPNHALNSLSDRLKSFGKK